MALWFGSVWSRLGPLQSGSTQVSDLAMCKQLKWLETTGKVVHIAERVLLRGFLACFTILMVADA
jgi:hypothetical protein